MGAATFPFIRILKPHEECLIMIPTSNSPPRKFRLRSSPRLVLLLLSLLCLSLFISRTTTFVTLSCYSQTTPTFSRIGSTGGRLSIESPRLPDVVIRSGGLTIEGIGSSLQHFKSSILLAEILNRELILNSDLRSEHNYSLTDVFNNGVSGSGGLMRTPICRVYEFFRPDQLARALEESCETENQQVSDNAHAVVREAFEGCGTIMHDVDYELSETLNGCTKDWLRRRMLGAVCGRKEKKQKRPFEVLKVGVHIRWGDVAPDTINNDGVLWGLRSMRAAEINTAVERLGNCGIPIQVKVYSERLSPVIQSSLNFDYDLVDSGDDLSDLCDLSDNDVLLVGGSSFGVAAFQLSNAALLVVSDNGGYKYAGTATKDFLPLTFSEFRQSNVCAFVT